MLDDGRREDDGWRNDNWMRLLYESGLVDELIENWRKDLLIEQIRLRDRVVDESCWSR